MLAAMLLSVLAGADALPDFDRMWNWRDPAATEKRFRALLVEVEERAELDYRLQLRTQIARTLGLQGKFDESHAVLDAVDRELTDATRVARLRSMLERGRAFNSSKKKEKARPLFAKAWDLACEWKLDYWAVDAGHMMGIAEVPEKQVAWAEKTLALAEKSKDKRARGWLGPLYNNLGWTYFDLKQYDKALATHEKSYAFRIAAKHAPQARYAKNAVGRMLRALGRIDEALKLQKELEVEWKAAGREEGFVLEEIAECLHAQGRTAEARPYFRRAHALLAKMGWLKTDEPDRLARLERLGREPE